MPQILLRSALVLVCLLFLVTAWRVYRQAKPSVRASQQWELRLTRADGTDSFEVKVLRRLPSGVEYRLLAPSDNAGIYWWPLEKMDTASQQVVLSLPLSPPALTPELRRRTRMQLESLRLQIHELTLAISTAEEPLAQQLGAQRLRLYRQAARLQEQVLIYSGEVTTADLKWLFGP